MITKNFVTAINEFVRPPEQPVFNASLDQFIEVENILGLELPVDYKELVVTYGDGYWQGFWFLLNPFTDNLNLNLIAQASRDGVSGYDILSVERNIKKIETDYPHKIWPEESGIFPWGIADNGGSFFWITVGNACDWPTIYYPSRDPNFQNYDMSVSEIILGAVSGTLPIFSDEFDGETVPEDVPIFEKLNA